MAKQESLYRCMQVSLPFFLEFLEGLLCGLYVAFYLSVTWRVERRRSSMMDFVQAAETLEFFRDEGGIVV